MILLNLFQMLAFYILSTISISLWQLLALTIPISRPPTLSPPIILAFVMFYLPILTISMLFTPPGEHVMKNTPRKNILEIRVKDKVIPIQIPISISIYKYIYILYICIYIYLYIYYIYIYI